MAEPLWYYGQDGRECGPVSLARLTELLLAGTVKPADLVWCEGMKDWTPANRVKALGAAAAQAQPGVVPTGGPTAAAAPVPKWSEKKPDAQRPPLHGSLAVALKRVARPGLNIARAVLMSGLALVVLARGCDGLAQRNVQRLAAKVQATQQQFDDEWEAKRLDVQQSLDTLKEGKNNLSPEDRKEQDRLNAQLNDLQKQQAAVRKPLKIGEWRNQEIAARDAKTNNAIWDYWREWLFVVGSILFTVGLILSSIGGEGMERWISLALLGIIVYSLYVGGAAWSVR